MLSIKTEPHIEKVFQQIIQKKYNGDVTQALISFIEYERWKELSWKEKFQYQLDQLRQTVKKMNGISDQQIDLAIKNYREKKRGAEKTT